MTEPQVQELERGHPWADDFTAWHSKQAQLFQLTPRAHAARWWGESSADELTANKLVRIKNLSISWADQREYLGLPATWPRTAKSSRRDSGLSAAQFRPQSLRAVRKRTRKVT